MKPLLLLSFLVLSFCTVLGQSKLSVGLSFGPGARYVLDDKSWVEDIGGPIVGADAPGNNYRLELNVRAKLAGRHFINAAHALAWQRNWVEYQVNYLSSFFCDCLETYPVSYTSYTPSISHEYLLASNGKMAAYLSSGLRLDILRGYAKKETGLSYLGKLNLEYVLTPRFSLTASPFGSIGRFSVEDYGNHFEERHFSYGLLLGMAYRS